MRLAEELSASPELSTSPERRAGRHGLETLLNCYCREVAGPEGHCHVGPFLGQQEWPVPVRALLRQGQALQVQLPRSRARLLAVVAQASPTGNYRYRSAVYCAHAGRGWQVLDWRELARLVIGELAAREDLPFNDELMVQIEDSVAVTAAILERGQPALDSSDPVLAFIQSEQGLRLGHPFHPAPKSRLGFAPEELARYSPELGAAFPLHYFAVRPEDLCQRSILARDCAALVAEEAPEALAPEGFVLMPAHPWQAAWLRGRPAMAAALREDRVRDLGPAGPAWHATSSIRTLYRPEAAYFYKFSLHVRITNCLRKNADYELDGALQVSALMGELLPALQARFPSFAVLAEPAYMSVDLGGADEAQRRELKEGFGLILREGFADSLRPGAVPLLSGALFGDGEFGQARLAQVLVAAGAEAGLRPELVEAWFAAYVETVMFPVLHAYFEQGLVFEPHLQNVVVGLERHWPAQVFLRDFEGVKLVRERWPAERLPLAGERAREALWYTNDQGWNRVSYCLFVNHFCEAIQQLAALCPGLERRLWAVVAQALQHYQAHHGDAASALRINRVLAGQPFPMKGHLINRFLKRADKAAPYLALANPLAVAAGGWA
ncbi:MAG: iron transporter [Gammaproteobacteria bacterium]|nr:iron transporter [Gammaproteobacteria bacterium]